MNRTIVIGDVHGCIEELNELFDKLRVTSADRVVFAGDLIDRGPDPVGVVRIARMYEAVLGNHDEKAARWRRREAERLTTGRANKMQAPHPDRRAQWEALSTEDLAWIDSLPTVLDIGDNWVVVHGGFEPKHSLISQQRERVIRCRFVDEVTGNMIGQDNDDPWGKPAGAVYWAERWTRTNVVYGHAVHSLSKPRVDRHSTTECWGIDTGCVFGGHLTALVLPTMEIVQVRAKRVYAEPPVPLAP